MTGSYTTKQEALKNRTIPRFFYAFLLQNLLGEGAVLIMCKTYSCRLIHVDDHPSGVSDVTVDFRKAAAVSN